MKEHFQNIFDELTNKGFHVKKPLLWTFFFYSSSKNSLTRVVKELDGYGYTIEVIGSDNEFRLMASKSEILIPEKLEKRNTAFYELADYCNVAFDGWEVSK